MKNILRIGFIGYGARGRGLLKGNLMKKVYQKDGDFEIVGVCDGYEDRARDAADIVEQTTGKRPFATTDYKEILKLDIDAVIIAAAWEAHIDIACAAMEAGIYTGLEVGGAYSLEDCWRLVRTYERTGTPCMLLENCCYGKREMMTLNMARQGVFGEISHCSGGYCHDLRKEITEGIENRHYRLRNYTHRNCDNYPTHALVPLGKVLKINDGNRFVSLVSMASSAQGLHAYSVKERGPEHELSNIKFNQGDVVSTIIKCSGGQTITLTLDTTLPRAYSREYTVHGTKAAYFEQTDSFFFDEEHFGIEDPHKMYKNAEQYEEKYLHPLWQGYDASGGHGGMDYLLLRAFIESAKAEIEPPIDAYDAATYMAITALTEKSIAEGGAPQAIPDFTTGRWMYREPAPQNAYSLR